MQVPETEFAHCGDVQIAYQVYGSGPAEVVVCGGPAGHVEVYWEEPTVHRWHEQLGRFARVAIFDRRGTGASDAGPGPPSEALHMEDMAAVIKACGFERPALLGAVEGARTCARFAAAHPEAVSGLVLIDAAATGRDVLTEERVAMLKNLIDTRWGKGDITAVYAPTLADNESFRRWFARLERQAVTPYGGRQILEMIVNSDVSAELPKIKCPTLVLHHRENALVPLELGRNVAEAIPNAQFVTVEGQDSMAWLGDTRAMLGEVEEFLTGARTPHPDTRLATILFTDVVGSTELATRIRPEEWQRLLGRHDQLVRRELELAEGTVVKATGDGFLAVFHTPHAAVRAAEQAMRATAQLGLKLRAGVHVGTVEELVGDVRGIAVHIAARIVELAGPGQVLLSSTTRDVLIDSRLPLRWIADEPLRGVPGKWSLYEVPAAGRESPQIVGGDRVGEAHGLLGGRRPEPVDHR